MLHHADGDFSDSSNSGNHGSPNGGVQITESGCVGGAYVFDGVDDGITVPNPRDLNMTDSISVSAWIKSTQPYWNQFSVIRHEGHFTALQEYSWVSHCTRFQGGGISDVNWWWNTSFSDGEWHLFACSYDKDDGIKVYRDGELLKADGTITGL